MLIEVTRGAGACVHACMCDCLFVCCDHRNSIAIMSPCHLSATFALHLQMSKTKRCTQQTHTHAHTPHPVPRTLSIIAAEYVMHIGRAVGGAQPPHQHILCGTARRPICRVLCRFTHTCKTGLLKSFNSAIWPWIREQITRNT